MHTHYKIKCCHARNNLQNYRKYFTPSTLTNSTTKQLFNNVFVKLFHVVIERFLFSIFRGLLTCTTQTFSFRFICKFNIKLLFVVIVFLYVHRLFIGNVKSTVFSHRCAIALACRTYRVIGLFRPADIADILGKRPRAIRHGSA